MYVVQATPTTRGIPLHECMYVCENHVIVLVSKVRASSGHMGVMCHNTDIRVYMTNLFNLHVGRLLLSKYGEKNCIRYGSFPGIASRCNHVT